MLEDNCPLSMPFNMLARRAGPPPSPDGPPTPPWARNGPRGIRWDFGGPYFPGGGRGGIANSSGFFGGVQSTFSHGRRRRSYLYSKPRHNTPQPPHPLKRTRPYKPSIQRQIGEITISLTASSHSRFCGAIIYWQAHVALIFPAARRPVPLPPPLPFHGPAVWANHVWLPPRRGPHDPTG